MSTDDFINKVNENIKKAMEESMLMVEADAKLLCGVKTGTLKRSITHETTQEDNITTGSVGSNVEYAPFHELHNPFLENAVDKNKAIIQLKFQKILGDLK